MSRHHYKQAENIYSSACIQALEQEYCSSCSAAVVSSHGLGARIMSRIYDGGRKAVYTAAVGAMLANNMVVPAYADPLVVSAGETSTGLVVSYGTAISAVEVYGTTSQTKVYDGGETIFNGGVANDTTINEWGCQIIYNGGVANDTTINEGGSQYISNGGVARDTIVNSGGSQNITNGGSAINTVQEVGGNVGVTVGTGSNWDGDHAATYVTGTNASGQAFSLQNGVASNFILYSGVLQEVSSGGVARDTIVNTGAHQYIYNGGSAINTVQEIGGNVDVCVNGGDTSTYVTGTNASGQAFSLQNGVASNFIVYSGGSQYIYNGGVANDTTINEWGSQYIANGGVASDTIVNSGGRQSISNGGRAINTVQEVGGNVNVNVSGGVSTYVTGTNASGQAFSLQNGVASNFILYSGGSQYIYNGGVANDTIVNSGGYQSISNGGVANDTIVNSGGRQNISNGGSAINTVQEVGGNVGVTVGTGSDWSGNLAATYVTGTNASGQAFSLQSSVASNFIIYSGGWQIISKGGVASDTIVNSGGSQYISNGGVASDTIVNSGGDQYIGNGGSSINTVQEVGGNVNVMVGTGSDWSGNLAATYVTGTNASGQAFSLQNGVASNFILYSSGYQGIFNGGVASDTIVNSGGSQYVSEGGVASDTIVNSGGDQYIYNGGSSINTVQEVGGNVNVTVGTGSDWSGNLAATYVTGTNASGQAFSLQNGVASNFILYAGGSQWISNGGVASDTVMSGGNQWISNGGVANDTIVNSGGWQGVIGGVANDTIVNSGGSQNITNGGTANDTVMSGGTINLYNDGTLNNLTATGGALNVLYADNTLSGNINLANASVNFSANGNQTVNVENLSANNATFNMRVNLEDQTGDQLNIVSSYSGNATIGLTNVAASAQETTGDGIKLVDFDSSATVNGTFSLPGGRWDEGSYVYKLFQNEGDPDYYLRSTQELTDTFKTMLNMPVMNVVVAQAGMNSLQKRLGDLRGMNNPGAKQGVWVRSYYKDMTVKDLIKTDMSLFGAEAGYDWLFRAEEPTKLYAGVLVGFVDATNIKTHKDNGTYDKGEGESPSVGVYATLLNEDGWFVDIAARNFWTKLDMKNYASDGTELAYKPKRNVIAASVEVGKDYQKDIGRNEYIRIEPKVEVGYMNAASGNAEVSNGVGDLHYDSANYVNAKAGVLLAYNKIRDNGLLIAPLIELAYRQEFAGTDKISYGGAEEKSKLNGGTFEVNAGLNMELTKDLYWYGLGSYEASDKVKGWGLHAGIRYAFGGDKTATTAKEVKKAAPKKQGSTQKLTITEFIPGESIKKEEVKQVKKSSGKKKDYSFMYAMERQWREGK